MNNIFTAETLNIDISGYLVETSLPIAQSERAASLRVALDQFSCLVQGDPYSDEVKAAGREIVRNWGERVASIVSEIAGYGRDAYESSRLSDKFVYDYSVKGQDAFYMLLDMAELQVSLAKIAMNNCAATFVSASDLM